MPDLSDPWVAIRELQAEVRRLRSGIPLENSSVTNGRLRFIGGLLLIDSGGTLQIIGALDGEGTFRWVGPWEFDSPEGGRIAGDVDLAGDFDLTGKLTAGNVRIEDGRIYVGSGSNLIVIDGVTGKITVGDMVLDPSNHDGMITMPNDGQVLGADGNLELYGPNGTGGRNGVIIKPDHIALGKIPESPSMTGLSWVAADPIGNLWRVPQGVGGPEGGPLQWPFSQTTITAEYGPRESPGPGGSTFHEGMDFAPGEGLPIPAAGSGTVELAGTNGGFGNCVIIDHGNGLKTLYGHMQSTPSVSVGQTVSAGTTIGAVGNTGVSFGAHLHFEVHVNGSPVNPRTKLPTN